MAKRDFYDILGVNRDASEDEIVRRKETEFTPMTEEEALIQIDLLGHDFFAYTDRDTNLVHILYRREDGGYGLLLDPQRQTVTQIAGGDGDELQRQLQEEQAAPKPRASTSAP